MAPKRRRTAKSKELRPWSSLPLDVMENIMRRLYYADHLRLIKVCKEWRSMYCVPPLVQLPWLMAFEDDDDSWSSCKLFDPVYKKTYTLQVDDRGKGVLQGKPLVDIQIHACRDGWLLMSDTKNPTGCLFLYTPFANGNIITLPRLDSTFQIATFSSTPTHQDCVFFALNSQPNSAVIQISTCGCHDREWITYTFECNSDTPLQHSFSNVIYMEGEGKFFCSTRTGTVGTYDIAQQQWKMLEISEPAWAEGHWLSRATCYMVESSGGGEIFLIRIFDHTRIISSAYTEARRLDRQNLTWDPVGRLNGEVVFVGGCDVLLSTSVARRKSDREVLSNRIFGCWGSVTRYFSLKPVATYPCKRLYGSLSLKNCKKIWIQRPTFGIPTSRCFDIYDEHNTVFVNYID